MNARTYLDYRADSLEAAREQMRKWFRAGGMSSQELYDLLNFTLSQCDEHDGEQKEIRDKLSTICADMETDEPDSDAYRFIEPAKLDSRVERP